MDQLSIAAQHACLGFKALGLCDYDPAKPFTVYFAPGAAVGALAFTLAVQQLLKPVHRFRLSARYLTLPRIYVFVFGGVLAVVVASILPNITTLHESPFGYAINWEILAVLLFAVSYGAVVIAIVAHTLLGSLNSAQYEDLYVLDPKKYRADVLETLVEIVFEALAAVSNKFKGFEDPFWIMVIQTVQRAYPQLSHVPDGFTPFQQRLALKLIDKLSDNMRGYYPAICRVLLAWVGPYVHAAAQPNRTAFNILKDAVYFELQKLPQLAASKPDKVAHYLPDNVTFDPGTTDLVHTYRSGTPSATRLSTMNLGPISLVANDIRNTYGIRLAIINLLKQRSTKRAPKGRAVSGRPLRSKWLTRRPRMNGGLDD